MKISKLCLKVATKFLQGSALTQTV